MKSFRRVEAALRLFERDPANWQAFDDLDLMVRVLAAKWEPYATARRAGACGIDVDCPVNLLD